MMRRRFILACCFASVVAGLSSRGALAAPSANRTTPLVRAIRRVRSAVVNIQSEKRVEPTSGAFRAGATPTNRLNGMGTGVIVDERGWIVTNYHVVENVSNIRVTLADQTTYGAEVVARDPETDLALIRIQPKTPLPTMPFGSSDDLMYGEPVVAIGNAYGYHHSITRGIISELHRDVRLSDKQMYRDLIQTDASINPGNSGGPLINADGEMIGLNVAIRAGAQGIGFAIPVNDVSRVLGQLMSIRQLNGCWHGIVCRSPAASEAETGGVVLRRIEPGSPAESAGLWPGDRLLQVGAKPIHHVFDVERALLGARPTDAAPLLVDRGGKRMRFSLVVRSAPTGGRSVEDLVWQRLGIRVLEGVEAAQVQHISTRLRGGLLVTDAATDGPAARAGLKPGDILIGLEGLQLYETVSVRDVAFVINERKAEDLPIRFLVVRDGELKRGWLELADRNRH